ncbi:MAG: hypothetical protein L0387_33390, partial [Acidobacteria bacterium]|nr:hypothetical protein [Acidobacteriota bacterium]
LRVRDGKPNTDAEHRVPTGSGLYAQPNFFTAPLAALSPPERGTTAISPVVAPRSALMST